MKTDFDIKLHRRACAWLVAKSKNLWWRYIWYPALTTLPVLLLAPISRSGIPSASSVEQRGVEKYISEFLDLIWQFVSEHIVVAYVLVFFYVALVRAVGAGIVSLSKSAYSLDREDIIYLHKAANTVVGAKMQRFFDSVKFTKNNPLSASDTFFSITQPDEQIKLMVHAISSVIEYIDKKYKTGQANVEIGLLKIEDGLPVDWMIYKNGAPSVSAGDLGVPESAVMRCLKSKKTLIINDIEKEVSKKGGGSYHVFQEDGDNSGSLLCFPSKFTPNNSIPYVVVLKTSEKNYFKPEGLYEWAIDGFVSRMLLEHSLVILKERALRNEN